MLVRRRFLPLWLTEVRVGGGVAGSVIGEPVTVDVNASKYSKKPRFRAVVIVFLSKYCRLIQLDRVWKMNVA